VAAESRADRGAELEPLDGPQQPLGIFNGMERVGVYHVAKAATVWARNALTLKTVSMITDKSDMMRARYGTASKTSTCGRR
jgi:hypothetical protein